MRCRFTKTIILLLAFYHAAPQESDSLIIQHPISLSFETCKNPQLFYLPPIILSSKRAIVNQKDEPSRKNFSVSGEIGYSYFERSASDESIVLLNARNDIATATLNVLYKEKYPFTVSFSYNKARPFQMDNQFEISIESDEQRFRELTTNQLIELISRDVKKRQLDIKREYTELSVALAANKQYLQSPVYQEQGFRAISPVHSIPPTEKTFSIAESKLKGITAGGLTEKVLSYSEFLAMKTRIQDSLSKKATHLSEASQLRDFHNSLLSRRDSIERRLKSLEDSLQTLTSELYSKIDSVKKAVSEIYSPVRLNEFATRLGLTDSLRGRGVKNLFLMSKVRAGKFLLNHSELTVNNIFLSGLSIKYGTEKFLMFSAGTYDFSFRRILNFRHDTASSRRPSVFAIRVGKTDGRSLTAATFYLGRKEPIGNVKGSLRTVAGFSIERKIHINRNFNIGLEIAKSTTRTFVNGVNNSSTFKDLFSSFNTRTIAFNGVVDARFPKSNTSAEVKFRYWGQQFESFNASQYFTPQNSFSARVSQILFNRKLSVSGGLRYTDFQTFGISSNMKSRSFFASANAALRLKKLPVVSVGYYPGSQFYWIDDKQLYEYFYYILNSTISHYFKIASTPVQIVLTANKFYTHYSDSIIHSAKSFCNVFATAWRNNFSINVSVSRQDLEFDALKTIEAGLTYANKGLKIGGSLKSNYASEFQGLGYNLIGGVIISKVGTINFVVDKAFLPGRAGQFIPVNTAQIQIIKPIQFKL